MEELLARLRAALRRDDGTGLAPRIADRPFLPAIDLAPGDGRPRDRIDRATRTGRVPPETPPRHAGRAGPAHPDRVAAAGDPASATPASWSAAAGCSPRSGGPDTSSSTNYLRFHMARLRRKLEDDPARPRHLLTEPGMGYRYQP